jgi:hypothetical protein
MRKIYFENKWKKHIDIYYIYLEGDNVIGSYIVEMNKNNVILKDFYIQPNYRLQKYSIILLREFLLKYQNIDKLVCVEKDNWFLSVYEKYGFEFDRWASNDNGVMDQKKLWLKKSKDN